MFILFSFSVIILNICAEEVTKMKKLKLLLIILCLSLLLTGCGNFRLTASIDDLVSPVSPSAENAGVQSAVDEYCKSGYLIKIPSSGNYTTSFIFYDLDSDGANEAIAFYEPSDDRATVSLAVLKKTDSKWSVIHHIRGEGAEVRSVDFCDLNNDGTVEILVCWNVISRSTNSRLAVYEQLNSDSEYKLNILAESVAAGEFVCTDINSDGVNEVLVFNLGSSAESPKAELYSFVSGDWKIIGRTKLDNSIISFENIICSPTEEGMSVYADALKSDGSSMVTEFIYWSDYYNSIVSPFYSYATGKTAKTARSSMINSKDIDGDNIVEIPVDKDVDNIPAEITAQNWLVYQNTVLVHKRYTYSCKRDRYSLLLNDALFSDCQLKYDDKNRVLAVYQNGSEQELFSIMTVIKTAYNSEEAEKQGYFQLFNNSGLVYLAKINGQSDAEFTINELKNMVKSY